MIRSVVLNIIAAIDQNRGIGFDGKLLYWIPNDLKRFRKLTYGHTVIMGRKTFESLPNGALPGRRNIVLSHQNKRYKGAITLNCLTDALSLCEDEEIYVIGGESVYNEALPFADTVYLTEIDVAAEHVDSFFPKLNLDEWELIESEKSEADEICPHSYSYNVYQRKNKNK